MSFYHCNPNTPGERLARKLEAIGSYRVLRRLPDPADIWCRSMPVPGNVFKLAILDCETTGLDPERHRMIEFAVGTLTIDLDGGDVVDVEAPRSWLEDPAEDLSIEIERLTQITSDMLIGQWFREDEIAQVLTGCDAIVAHNAPFDRAFVTRRFPTLAALPWLCSMREVDWPELGFSGGRGIAHLLTQAGFYLPDAHRAAADVWATICLLASATNDGSTIAAALIERSRGVTHRLYATRAPFQCKDVLKAAGYRWSAERRAWWIEGEPERIANEAVWLRGLSSGINPQIENVDWISRYQ
ncbi:3'-5' exonuclease [Sphingomonas sp. BK345]|uniref:3'-5' exonuclease n=1 Tax=Sphingomonas sp. BK345 TaxID=2586980 RepID=UPI00160D67BA|nr:3'-5' exonuclease [Sphingomonas sp. BK345]MBB3472753.1 DNA polymerase-3 subunit epsilon [Sphingomonas sp. BK345]